MALPVSLFIALVLWLPLGSYVQCDSRRPLLRNPQGSAGTGCYFVVLHEKATEEEMLQLMVTISKLADDSKIYSEIHTVSKAFTVKLSPFSLELVRRMPAVDYIEEEGFAVGMHSDTEWHLDRLDQLSPNLDSRYQPIGDGLGVDVYILDSGINYDHEEFEYRAKYGGMDPTDDYNQANSDETYERLNGRDCHGHGTHVASLCGGKTYGSAKKVTLYSIRVLGCNNAGPWSVVLTGIEHVVNMSQKTGRPSIISMSLSGDSYRVVDGVVNNAISRGVHVVVAAGNGQKNSCDRSPANSDKAITVGGTKLGDGLYLLGAGTNFGACINIFAPGERILGADLSCNNCSKMLSGTSMATPLVSGLLAIKLRRQPLLTPEKLKDMLIEESVKDIIDFAGMPDQYKEITPNRLATIQGSCGEINSILGHDNISSPNFPSHYPPNLDCRWVIGGEEKIIVRLNISFVNVEESHDVLRVYDGCCENQVSFVKEFTGNLGLMEYSYLSKGNVVCLQFITDGSNSGAGFNGSFTKMYVGTDLTVPNVPIRPPSPPRPNADVIVIIKMSPRQARNEIKNFMKRGYKLTWIASYRLGPSFNPYFDFIATNSSEVDTKSYVEISFDKLNASIHQMKKKGYFVKLLIDRIRGKNPTEPSYSVIFEPRNSIFETQVFLRDNYKTYLSRLKNQTDDKFRLISQSFCSIQRKIEVTSVYIRDKRLNHNITTPYYPKLHIRSNLTFFQFTDLCLKRAKEGFYPHSVEVYKQEGASDSFFSVIFEERHDNSQGNWFRWSLNTTAANELIQRESRRTWDVYLTVGYTYRSNMEHFIEFKRKGI